MKNTEFPADALKNDLARFHPDVISSAFVYAGNRVALVFRDPVPGSVQALLAVIKKAEQKKFLFPFALSRDFLQSSLDTFPLEILEMKSGYRLIIGDDPLTGLTVETQNVRLQCERELKGKGLHLRSALLHRRTDKALAGLVNLSAEDFHRVYLGLLFLKGENLKEGNRIQAAQRVTELFGIEGPALVRVASGEVPKKGIQEFYISYLNVIDRLSKIVDGGQ